MTYFLCHILLIIILANYVLGDILSSLTFVIDETYSMSNDIEAVKRGASQIFETVLRNRNESQIDNFILVTFNDHARNSRCDPNERGILRAKTKELHVFKDALARINVDVMNWDCAECSMEGIKLGLEESLPRSNVYVFTDASAKDYYRYEEVKKFALEKESQIVFVLTGMCPEDASTASLKYKVYEDIARETGGEVFHIDKYSIDKVLDYVKETIKGRLYEVNTTFLSPGPNIITLNIDALMGEVFFTLSSTSTNDHSVKMTDPDGIDVYRRIVFTTDKSSSYAFTATKLGPHSIEVNTTVKARAKLSVRSAVEFGHGFSSIAVDSLMDTSSMPAPDAKTHLLIKLNKGDIALKTVRLLDMYNNLIQELPLNMLDNATKLYMTEEFEPPKVTFKIEITSYDAKSDSTIVRRSGTGLTLDTISPGETMTNKPATAIIKDAPKINANYNEQLKLTCNVEGYPKPDIIWKNEAKGINYSTETMPGKNHRYDYVNVLTIEKVTENETYTCEAKNAYFDSKQIAVEVIRPKYLNIKNKTENITVEYEREGKILCIVDAYPPADISWYKNSRDLFPGDNVEIIVSHELLDKSVLTIKNSTLGDEGKYTCVARNEVTNSSIDVYYTIIGLERPEIYKKVSNANVIKGLNTTIDCKILKGKPKPTISWYFETTSASPLENSTNQEQIVIIDAHETDSGKYICQAKNEVGIDQHKIQVLVEVPATIIPPRQLNLTLQVGYKKSTLRCQARGVPKPEIKWVYQSFDTSLPPKEMIEHKGIEQLDLENVQLSHEGYYNCVASNSAGSSRITFIVTVLEAPSICKSNTTDIHVDLGTNVELECKILKGKPKPSITWYFRFGRTDDDSSAHFIKMPKWNDQESILVENAEKEDTGTYECRASNSVSTDYHDTTLVVDYAPKVKTQVNFLKPLEKSKVSILCSADGSPQPNIIWLKDEVQLVNDSIYTIRPGSLRFDAQRTAAGNYTCKATNRLGSDFKIVRVYISEPATIVEPKTSSFSLAVGSSVVLPCQSNGFPVPIIRWTYQSFGTRSPDEKILKHSTDNLHLEHLKVSDAGYYTCTAVNTGSNTNLTYEVQVFAPPKIVNTYKENIFLAVEGDLVLKIDCNVTGDPIPKITWTMDDLNLALGSVYHIQNGTLFIYDLPEDASGIYRCEVENARGKDLVSYEVIVHKYPWFSRPVSQVFIRQHQSQKIECPLPHTLIDGLRWYKNQVLICKGELVINDASQRDTGNYICRVSTLEKAHNSAVEVIVGDVPEFKSIVNENINMIEGFPVTLNCETNSIPEGNIKWYHNDEELNATNAIYYFPAGLNSPGLYKCDVRNRFGNISRTFSASQPYCVLESSVLMMNNKAAPLMLSSNLSWLTPEKSDQNLIISKETQMILFCPNKFEKFPTKYIFANCNSGANFVIYGVKRDYSDIKCAEDMVHTVQRTHSNCISGEMDTDLIKIGYNVYVDIFTTVYEVCLNKTSEIPIYTKHIIQKSLANDTYSESSWSDEEHFKMDFEEAYTCADQVKSISVSLNSWFHHVDKCCFSKRQLVSPKDVFPGVPQKSTFSYFNVVPQWGTCNGQNWDEVEQRVRNYASKFDNLLVWTGTAEQLSLEKYIRGTWADIFISDSRSKQPVPLFLWKVIQNPANMSSIAIIQVNKPDLTEKEVSTGKYNRCTDQCDEVHWMRNLDWQDVNRGYIYCCKLEEFENAFGFKGVFEPDMDNLPV